MMLKFASALHARIAPRSLLMRRPWTHSIQRLSFSKQSPACARRCFHATRVLASKQSPYDILGVSKTASAADIKKAYFKLAKKYHPDVYQNASAEEKEKGKAMFQKVQEAYEILGDEEKRRTFDQFGDTASHSGAGFGGFGGPFQTRYATGAEAEDYLREFFSKQSGGFGSPFGAFEDIFRTMHEQQSAGSPGGFRFRDPEEGPKDITTKIAVSFMEAIKGARRLISYTAWSRCNSCAGHGLKPDAKPKRCHVCGGSGKQTIQSAGIHFSSTCMTCGGAGTSISHSDVCTKCKGNGKVKERKETIVNVPAGVSSNETIRLPRYGHFNAGDLYITVAVADPAPSEAMFKRQGADILVEIPIPFYQAILGAKVSVPLLDTRPINAPPSISETPPNTSVEIRPGTQTGSIELIRGLGIQKLGRPVGTRGDVKVKFQILIPKLNELSSEQKSAIEMYRIASEKMSSSKNESNQKADDDMNSNEDSKGNGKGFFKKFGFKC